MGLVLDDDLGFCIHCEDGADDLVGDQLLTAQDVAHGDFVLGSILHSSLVPGLCQNQRSLQAVSQATTSQTVGVVPGVSHNCFAHCHRLQYLDLDKYIIRLYLFLQYHFMICLVQYNVLIPLF